MVQVAEARQATQAGSNVKPMGGAQPEGKLEPAKRGNLDLREFSNNDFRHIVKASVTPRTLEMHPNYWNLLSEDLHEGDTIQAIWSDRSYIAHYVVVATNAGAVAVRLVYEVQGAPALSAIGGPASFPEGYRIEKTKPGENPGFVVVRESDGLRILNPGGVPWAKYQDAHEQFPKHAMFRSEDVTRRIP